MAKTEDMNLYQKLAAIRKQVDMIQKNKSGYGYNYVSEDEILARVSVLLEKYGLLLIPSIVPQTGKFEPYHTVKTKTTKGGDPYEVHSDEVLVSADMYWSWVDIEDPEHRLDVPWYLVGQQSDASQALGSGLTYSNRYFLMKFFNIATPDSDPDVFRSKQRAAEAAADKTVADEIITNFDGLVRDFLASPGGQDRAEEVKALVTKYVKGGDYSKITDPAIASRLLNDFSDKFLT